jgi:signal transduction histidine kinase
MPATGSRVARTAFAGLIRRCAVGLRVGSAVAAGVAAFAGLAPPASTGPVAVAVAVAAAWAVAYPFVLRGGRRWPVAVDAALSIALCLAIGRLVPAAVLTDTTSWVFLYASTTVIITPLVARPLVAAAVAVAVPAAYALGLELAPAVQPPGGALLLLVQGGLVTALTTVLRRAATGADAAVLQREATERQAAVRAARRAQEREHYRLLHDSVSATLTVLATGGIAGSSPTLRAQARRDLAVIERLNADEPVGPAVGDLPTWLDPVVSGERVTVEAPIPVVPVPAAVGAALAGATAEALTNAVRHAAPAQVLVRAAVGTDGSVSVQVADDGPGFDPDAVPGSRRGVRESMVGRMRAVNGSATVSSRPGSGTRVLLRWPASGAGPEPAASPAAGPESAASPAPAHEPAASPADGLGEVIATRYRRGLDLVVILLVGVWHLGNDLLGLVSGWSDYRPAGAELAAWLALAAIGVAGARRLRHPPARPAGGFGRWRPAGRVGRWRPAGVVGRWRAGGRVVRWWPAGGWGGAWVLAGAALVATAVAVAAVPGPLLFAGTNWAWGAAGWFGVLLLLRRPPRELIAFLAFTAAIVVAVLARDGVLDRIGLARAATVIYGTAALQLTLLLAAGALAATAARAAEVAAAESAVRRRRQVAERLHADRRQRYGAVRSSVAPLLAALADGALDPADREVRHRCAVEASRLRRLFAETDDVADPLMHELRACCYIADRRGVVVDLQLTGRLPALDRDQRRSLTELPLLALAGAERTARVAVLGRSDEVAIGVLVDRPADLHGVPAVPAGAAAEVTVTVLDGEDRRWVEARWRR